MRCTRLLVGQTDPVKVHSTLKQYCTLALREAHDFVLESAEEEIKNGQHDDSDTSMQREKKERR
jgi:hypothetical protein